MGAEFYRQDRKVLKCSFLSLWASRLLCVLCG